MRIAVASDEGTRIASHFGMTRGFAIYDIVDGKPVHVEFRPNTFSGHARGLGGAQRGPQGHGPQGHGPQGHGPQGHGPQGHGPQGHGPQGHGQHSHGPILSALADCEVVISCGMGRRMYEDLQHSGKQAYITDETGVEQALSRFVEGSLPNYPERGCHHGHVHAHR